MQLYSSAVLFAGFLCFASIQAKAQGDVCIVTTYWLDQKTNVSSAVFNVGAFRVSAQDQSSFKSFHHEESGKTVMLGVEFFKDAISRGPRRIRLGIAFTGRPDNVFNEVDRAEAETVYSRKWSGLSLRKSVVVGERAYTFGMSCHRNSKLIQRLFSPE